MSLRGRYVIDRIKKALGKSFRMPVPPYGDADYWDNAYRSFGPQDSFEWGNVDLDHLLRYEHRPLNWETGKSSPTPQVTTLGATLGVHPHADEDEPMLMLGCGNSKLGEQMVEAGWRGPLIQVDVSGRVIESMSLRCAHYIENGSMNFIQDDATELSAFRPRMMKACLDKGLMDAVYCADEYDQCHKILRSVHRVLNPGGVFVFWSFSRPEYVLPQIVDSDYRKNRALWEDVQVQELTEARILLYRFQKVWEEPTANAPIRPATLRKGEARRGGKRR